MPHFVVMGWFNPDVDAALAPLQAAFNDQLADRQLRIAGPTHDADGRLRGWLGILEAESFESAERFMARSPYARSDLYERVEIFGYSIEVGRVD
jgi:uncharacterized protein YciI